MQSRKWEILAQSNHDPWKVLSKGKQWPFHLSLPFSSTILGVFLFVCLFKSGKVLFDLHEYIWLCTFWVLQVGMGKGIKRIPQKSFSYKYKKDEMHVGGSVS